MKPAIEKLSRSWLGRFAVVCGLFWWLVLPATPTFAQNTAHHEFLWVVTNRSSVVYLLGSVHTLRPTDHPLAETINQAFVQSDQVVFEIKFEELNSPVGLSYLSSKAIYPGADTLEQHVAPETYQLFKGYQTETGLVLSDKFRPWYVLAAVSSEETKRLGFVESAGVDRHYYDRARTEAKPILALEAATFQIDLLASAPPEQQEKDLRETLANRDGFRASVEEIVAVWKTGNFARLIEIIEQDRTGNPEYHQRFFTDRNVAWVPRIEEFLAGQNITLVIVGAGHLVGKDGVVNLLRSRGHAVTQLPVLPTRLIAVERRPGGSVELNFDVIVGHNYEIEGSSDLANWSALHRFVSAATTRNYVDTPAPASRFYRLRNLDASPISP